MLLIEPRLILSRFLDLRGNLGNVKEEHFFFPPID